MNRFNSNIEYSAERMDEAIQLEKRFSELFYNISLHVKNSNQSKKWNDSEHKLFHR
jgi:hypothetical protein